MNCHLFVLLCLLSVAISSMNIHLGTGGEPQANEMSNACEYSNMVLVISCSSVVNHLKHYHI